MIIWQTSSSLELFVGDLDMVLFGHYQVLFFHILLIINHFKFFGILILLVLFISCMLHLRLESVGLFRSVGLSMYFVSGISRCVWCFKRTDVFG